MLTIVGITGKQNSGKDTVAGMFTKRSFLRISFADPIKDAVHRMFKIPEHILWGPSELRDPTTRQILQELGTEFGRRFDADIWVKRTIERIDTIIKERKDPLKKCSIPSYGDLKIVVPDFRFLNEVQAFQKKYRATLIRVTRPDQHVGKDARSLTHLSETSLDSVPNDVFDFHIKNDRDLGHLYKAADLVAEELDV